MRSLAQQSKWVAKQRGASSKVEEQSPLSLAIALIHDTELVTVSALVLSHPPASSQIVKNVQAGWRTIACI